MTRILSIGEALIELAVTNRQCQLGVGGDSLNFAVYLKRLMGNAIEMHYVCPLGSGALNFVIRDLLDQEDIIQDYMPKIIGESTGLYAIDNFDNGEKKFSYWREQSPARHMFNGVKGDDFLNKISNADIYYLSGISLAILYQEGRDKLLNFIQKQAKQGKSIIFDSNYRPLLWDDHALSCDIYDHIMGLATNLLIS